MSRPVVMEIFVLSVYLFCPVESIELLLQIIVGESRSSFTSGLEEDTTAWVRDYVHTYILACKKAHISNGIVQ